MSMKKIVKGDTVYVLAGRCRGSTGDVLKILKKGRCAIVSGVNIVKKTIKANPDRDIQGAIESREACIDISNIAILNPVTKRPDRVGFKVLDDGKKVRYFKSDKEVIL